jgi:hypothetical protein
LELNPGLAATFPLLSSFAAKFQEYRFEQCIFRYKSLITEGNANAAGNVILTTTYNPDAPPYLNKRAAESADFTANGKVTDMIIAGIECNPGKNALGGTLYLRAGPLGPNSSKQTYDLGYFCVSMVGVPLNLLIGEIWVDYVVRLSKLSNTSSMAPLTVGEGSSLALRSPIGGVASLITQNPPSAGAGWPANPPGYLQYGPSVQGFVSNIAGFIAGTFAPLGTTVVAPYPLAQWTNTTESGLLASVGVPLWITGSLQSNLPYSNSVAVSSYNTSQNLVQTIGNQFSGSTRLQWQFTCVPGGVYAFQLSMDTMPNLLGPGGGGTGSEIALGYATPAAASPYTSQTPWGVVQASCSGPIVINSGGGLVQAANIPVAILSSFQQNVTFSSPSYTAAAISYSGASFVPCTASTGNTCAMFLNCAITFQTNGNTRGNATVTVDVPFSMFPDNIPCGGVAWSFTRRA